MSDFYRTYYQLKLTLRTPLAVGSGATADTDKDVIVDSRGNPFIPATAITGVLRSAIASLPETVSAQGIDGIPLDHALFGFIPSIALTDAQKLEPKNVTMPTGIRVYDACLEPGTSQAFFITTRDCVKLEKKVAVKGAKFDMQAVEPGAVFIGYLELLSGAYDAETKIEAALAALNRGELRLGSKTTRGYGVVSVEAGKKTFNKVDDWLSKDDIRALDYEHVDLNQASCATIITAKLRAVGGISIREYTTQVAPEGETAPDYISLSLHDAGHTPVIPGTSWAGAFRDRFAEIAGETARDDLFGFVKTDKTDGRNEDVKKSDISFNESRIEGGTIKKTTRNSIDRFSGATKDGALYTEITSYFGTTELCITIRRPLSDEERFALAACLADLHEGLLPIGGLTSVGRGLFEIESLSMTGKDGALTENIDACAIVNYIVGGDAQ